MSEYTLGFVGAGNMASAIIKGAVEKNVTAAKNIYVCDVEVSKIKALADELGIQAAGSLPELCE